jgi:ADP-ribose pyrophosphatase
MARMTPARWRKLSEHIAHRNPWWTYRIDRFALPDGREGEYHYVHTAGSVMIVPFDADGRILLVEQYRYLNERASLEFPGGSIPEGMAVEDAARKELAEETGFGAAVLEPVGTFNPYNGVTDEICRVFRARGLSPVDAEPDDTEDLRVHPVHPEDIDAMIADGSLWDGMTLAAWMMLRSRTSLNADALPTR